MPRFYLQYEDEDREPAVRPWTAWRVFLWTLLLASMALWMGSALAR